MTSTLLTPNMPTVSPIKSTQVAQLKQELEAQQGQFKEFIILADDDKTQVLAALAQAYQLSPSCGTNFDALYDGLTDGECISWRLQGLLISGLEESQLTPEERAIFLDVLSDVAQFWHEQKVQFLIFNVE